MANLLGFWASRPGWLEGTGGFLRPSEARGCVDRGERRRWLGGRLNNAEHECR
jgi:hypothetical protein